MFIETALRNAAVLILAHERVLFHVGHILDMSLHDVPMGDLKAAEAEWRTVDYEYGWAVRELEELCETEAAETFAGRQLIDALHDDIAEAYEYVEACLKRYCALLDVEQAEANEPEPMLRSAKCEGFWTNKGGDYRYCNRKRRAHRSGVKPVRARQLAKLDGVLQ